MLLTGILLNPSTNQHKHELRKVWPQAQISSDCVIQTVCKMDKLFQKVGSRTRKGRKMEEFMKCACFLLPTSCEV